MDAIRDRVSTPLGAGIIGFVIGLILGWFVIGWGLWPVQYVGAGPVDLRMEEKVDYLRMAVQAYGQTGDAAMARARYLALGEDADETLQTIQGDPTVNPALLQEFTAAVGAELVAPGIVTPGLEETPAVAEPGAAGGTGGGLLRTLLTVLCVVILFVVAGAIVIYLLRPRGGRGEMTPAQQAQEAARQAEWTDYTATGGEPPLAQFMASYKLGDDLFDDSFSIDSPAGEFLGECGVSISETIGVGDPKKVTAFEVWLFDKNDIQTVTKVLMSSHAFNDEALRQDLAARGEPVHIEPGTETVLETETLQMVARVVDMGYGEGGLPPESFFDRFIIELALWSKA